MAIPGRIQNINPTAVTNENRMPASKYRRGRFIKIAKASFTGTTSPPS
jgi:hypothetical protein